MFMWISKKNINTKALYKLEYKLFQALTKFLKCVNWNQPQETKQALELLSNWNPMDVEDALELLSPSFTHPSVRKYAVSRLRQADDEVFIE